MHLIKEKKNMEQNTGIRSISILRYLNLFLSSHIILGEILVGWNVIQNALLHQNRWLWFHTLCISRYVLYYLYIKYFVKIGSLLKKFSIILFLFHLYEYWFFNDLCWCTFILPSNFDGYQLFFHSEAKIQISTMYWIL